MLLRVSEHERNLIEQKMQQSGINNREAYLRKMAIDGYVINLDLGDVRGLVALMRNASNNMNQIAKRANETRNIYEADILDLQQRYDQLWEKANDILSKLAQM